ALAFGDVADGTCDAPDAIAIEQRLGVDFHPTKRAVGRQIAGFVPAEALAHLEHLLDETAMVLAILRVEVIGEVRAERRLDGEAGDFGPRRIQKGPVALEVDLKDHFLYVLDHRAVFDFAGIERFGRTLALDT